ncbi:Protein OSCA1, partial [Mucuna pruriens]
MYLPFRHAIFYQTLMKLLFIMRTNLQSWLKRRSCRIGLYERTLERPEMNADFLGLCGNKVDATDHHNIEIDKLLKEIALEKDKVTNDPKSTMPAAFVSFKTRLQFVLEPCDVYWTNLAIPYVSLSVRRLIIVVAFFFSFPFFVIPIAIVQTLASLDGIQKTAPHLFKVFYPLDAFINQPVNEYSITIGTAIPLEASFFITYIMVDGWAGIAAEVLTLKPLIIYHLKNFLLVKTEKDSEEAMDPGSIGLVYAAVTPTVLPFIIVFCGLAYVVFRN